MDSVAAVRRGETEAHLRLKRAAALWAQANGYSACAAEVTLPRCRYRADVAAYRPMNGQIGMTAIFECKQALPDLRRDNCCSSSTHARLLTVQKRREVLERCLRVHYPTLRTGESLFPEFDPADFGLLQHRNYARVTRELAALQNSLETATKFEVLGRYRCANLLYLVLPNELFRERELPIGWGVLVERDGVVAVMRKPVLHESGEQARLEFLQRIAAAGTRQYNRKLGITFDEVNELRRHRTNVL